jgi:hypothetical protein
MSQHLGRRKHTAAIRMVCFGVGGCTHPYSTGALPHRRHYERRRPILTVYIDLSEVGRVFGGPPRGNEHWTTDLHWLMTDRASEVIGADRAKCMVYSERVGRPFTSATDEAVIP